MEIEELKARLTKMEDPRQTGRGHALHKLEDISLYFLDFGDELPCIITKERSRSDRNPGVSFADGFKLAAGAGVVADLKEIGMVCTTVIRAGKRSTETSVSGCDFP